RNEGEEGAGAELGPDLDQDAAPRGDAFEREDRQRPDAGHGVPDLLALAHGAALDELVVELVVDGVGAGHGVIDGDDLQGVRLQAAVVPALAVAVQLQPVEDGGGEAALQTALEAPVEGVL